MFTESDFTIAAQFWKWHSNCSYKVNDVLLLRPLTYRGGYYGHGEYRCNEV